MSEISTEGYVVEGNLSMATRGHLVLYSVTGGRVDYETFANTARELDLSQAFVPPIRRPSDAFAIAKNALDGMGLPALESAEGWDGVVQRSIQIASLKRSSEYVVQVKMTGRARGRNHVGTINLFRLEFDPPEEFNQSVWRDAFMRQFWGEATEGSEAESFEVDDLNECISMTPYWDDTEFDAMLFARISRTLLEEFRAVATSIDQKMLRDKITKVLTTELGGLPFRSGQGAYFIPKYDENDSYLETLENYSNLLESFGNANALIGEASENSWLGENGKPRDWHRPQTNLRIMGYIDNERQLSYIRDDISMTLSREIAEYQQKLLAVADSFNEDKIEEFEAKLDRVQIIRTDLRSRMQSLSSTLGGSLNVNTDTYNDVASGLQSRMSAIRPVRSSIAERLSALTRID
jgi:hypothetical protein